MQDEPRAAGEGLPTAMRIAPPTRARSQLSRGGGELQPTPAGAPPDLPGVSAPDVAFQFKPCLRPETESAVINAVREVVTSAADVRMQCFENTDRLGIWMRPSEGAGDAAARDMGLRSLDLLSQGVDKLISAPI
jgi:hypothetical protein